MEEKERLCDQTERMRAAKREQNVERDDAPVSLDVAHVDSDARVASSSAEAHREPLNTAESSISSPGVELADTLFESDTETEEPTGELDPQTVFDDWMLTLTKPQR